VIVLQDLHQLVVGNELDKQIALRGKCLLERDHVQIQLFYLDYLLDAHLHCLSKLIVFGVQTLRF